MVSLKEEWSIPSQSPHIRGRKKEQLVSPSSTPIIDSVSGRCRDSTPRLGWEFMEMRFLLCTVDSSSKLLPISDSILKKKRVKENSHDAMTLQYKIQSLPHFKSYWLLPCTPALSIPTLWAFSAPTDGKYVYCFGSYYGGILCRIGFLFK